MAVRWANEKKRESLSILIEKHAGHRPYIRCPNVSRLRHVLKHHKRFISDAQARINLKHGSNIGTSITIVWGGPYSHQIPFREHEFVSFMHQLVSPYDHGQVVELAELTSNPMAKKVTSTSRTERPLARLQIFRIRPYQICTGRIRDHAE
jgi:hypothetical protein